MALKSGNDQRSPDGGARRPGARASAIGSSPTASFAELWAACDDGPFGRLVKLLMLTGQRTGEVQRHAVDRTRRGTTWAIPAVASQERATSMGAADPGGEEFNSLAAVASAISSSPPPARRRSAASVR